MKQYEPIRLDDIPEVNYLYKALLTHYEDCLSVIDTEYTLEDCLELCSEMSTDEGICWCSIAQFRCKFSAELHSELAAYKSFDSKKWCGNYIAERPRLCSTKEEIVDSLSKRIEVMKILIT